MATLLAIKPTAAPPVNPRPKRYYTLYRPNPHKSGPPWLYVTSTSFKSVIYPTHDVAASLRFETLPEVEGWVKRLEPFTRLEYDKAGWLVAEVTLSVSLTNHDPAPLAE